MPRPNIDLVGVAWLRSLAGVPSDSVATKLPSADKLRGGFVRWRSGLGGSPGTSIRRPIGAAECWAAPSAGSSQVPWGAASDLVEAVFTAADAPEFITVRLALPGTYGSVLVHSVRALGEPAKVEGDPSGFARFDVDLEINWTGVPQ